MSVIFGVPVLKLSAKKEAGSVPSCPMIFLPLVKKQPCSVERRVIWISSCIVTEINQEMVLLYCVIFTNKMVTVLGYNQHTHQFMIFSKLISFSAFLKIKYILPFNSPVCTKITSLQCVGKYTMVNQGGLCG